MGRDLDLDGYDSVEDYCDDNGGDPRNYDAQGRYIYDEDSDYDENFGDYVESTPSVHIKIPGSSQEITIRDGETANIKTSTGLKINISVN